MGIIKLNKLILHTRANDFLLNGKCLHIWQGQVVIFRRGINRCIIDRHLVDHTRCNIDHNR